MGRSRIGLLSTGRGGVVLPRESCHAPLFFNEQLMGSGIACRCKGTKEERKKNWEILQFKCNYSAFNGNRYTPSDYSAIHCTCCGNVWRTTSDIVYSLPRAK